MTSQGGTGEEEAGVWQTTDPFDSGQIANTEDEPTDRLTGVQTADPFADDRAKLDEDGQDGQDGSVSVGNGINEQVENPPTDPVSPGDDTGTVTISESAERALSGSNQLDERDSSAVDPSATSLAANTTSFDHAISATATEPTPSNDDSETKLEALNSNINGDRADRGTDVFANANPPDADSGHSDQSGNDHGEKKDVDHDSDSNSDSDSGVKDEKGRVTFAGEDKIDKARTHDDDISNGFMDQIKSTLSNVKDKIQLQEISATGPFKKMNPTNVRMRLRFEDDPQKDVGIIWRSRDNRKGRNSVVVPRTAMAYPNLPSKDRPVYSSSFKGVRRNLYRMAFTFPYWDMAFWSGWSYTWGSVLFVIDGCWAWIPVGWPETEINPGIEDYGIGVLFFVGAMLYQLGAVMAWLEAVNDGSFHGSAMKRFLEGHEEDKKKMLDEKVKTFFGHLNPLHEKKKHDEEEAELEKQKTVDPASGWKTVRRRERPGSIYPSGQEPGPRRGGVDLGEAEEGETHEYLQWRWWPTWHAFRYHHIYEIGYVACSIQLFGATLYSWCGLDAVHGVSDEMTTTQFYGAYWFPEILGSCCFLTASFMFLMETQEKWYKPQPNVMGWWIGFWAMIGSWGFLLNGLFGVVSDATGQEWAEFQSECATTWGSFGYLCSALCQWYEAVNKHPVEEGYFDDSGDFKSFQVHDV